MAHILPQEFIVNLVVTYTITAKLRNTHMCCVLCNEMLFDSGGFERLITGDWCTSCGTVYNQSSYKLSIIDVCHISSVVMCLRDCYTKSVHNWC